MQLRQLGMFMCVALALTACEAKKSLTSEQAAIAAKLRTAPPKSIIIYDSRASAFRWGLVCNNDHGMITHSVVGYAGAARCNSGHPIAHSPRSAADMVETGVNQIITPGDPAYQGKIERLMFDMLQ